jgi:hypothetical protein
MQGKVHFDRGTVLPVDRKSPERTAPTGEG